MQIGTTAPAGLRPGEREEMMKKEQVYISHVLFGWETFADCAEREERERKNGGARWTEEFLAEVRENILRYSAMENQALRNSCLNEIWKQVPLHFKKELFSGVVFPIWG